MASNGNVVALLARCWLGDPEESPDLSSFADFRALPSGRLDPVFWAPVPRGRPVLYAVSQKDLITIYIYKDGRPMKLRDYKT